MSAWLIWRMVKWMALLVWMGGVLGVLQGTSRKERMKSLGWATTGLVGVWFAGYLLMKLSGRTLREPWILWSLVSSLVSLLFTSRVAHRDRTSWLDASLVMGGFFAGIALMVLRGLHGTHLVMGTAALAVAGAGLSWFWRKDIAEHAENEDDLAERHRLSWIWFMWIARVEGVSLILLLLIATPLKYGAKIMIDGGTGALGWLHGIFSLLYVLALFGTGRQLGWSVTRGAIGFVLSLVPFGTFLFERIASPKTESPNK
ncbi:MAG: DUF3817 domain-containing protein [Myxococcales bacterium]|nr:DUF3817 domain-containing protein [Myxococcales bacterium]MCB9642873.1 DUF3817 domain-containing protein [Myxococcales bacterium]